MKVEFETVINFSSINSRGKKNSPLSLGGHFGVRGEQRLCLCIVFAVQPRIE